MKLFRFILIFSGIFFISSYTLVSQNEFSLWTVGSGGSKARFGTNIYRALDSLRESPGHLDKFLLSIAEKPLSVDQIECIRLQIGSVAVRIV